MPDNTPSHTGESASKIASVVSNAPTVRIPLALALSLVLVGCAAGPDILPPGLTNPDQFLMQQADDAAAAERWLDARDLYRRVLDGFPQSPSRANARLGVANTFLQEGSGESRILAAAEFTDFLRFFPTHPRADEAQFGLALTHHEEIRSPERDQTETRLALEEFQRFLDRYPDSDLQNEALDHWRAARDRLSEASYLVGVFYHRQRWHPGAIARFEAILAEDPEFGRIDGVYFYLADSLSQTDKEGEAIPYLERLIAEFRESEFYDDAHERLQQLTNQ